jgi:hypothetical protein
MLFVAITSDDEPAWCRATAIAFSSKDREDVALPPITSQGLPANISSRRAVRAKRASVSARFGFCLHDAVEYLEGEIDAA